MPKKWALPKPKILILISTIGLLAIVLIGLLIKDNFHKTKVVTPKGPESPQVDATAQPSSSASTPSKGSSTPTQSTSVPTDPSGQNATLTPPGGQLNKKLVSKSASQSDSNPSLEANCLTLAGAVCIVQVTSPSGQASAISPSYSDGQGSFLFDWSAKDYATGIWQVKLIATKNGATGTSNIGPLEVRP